jgi:hypothetical protein
MGLNLAKAMIQFRGFFMHPLPVAWTCVMLRAGLLMGDLLVVFQGSDALLDAAQLFREYPEVALIASLFRGHQPRFRQRGPKAIVNVANGSLYFRRQDFAMV